MTVKLGRRGWVGIALETSAGKGGDTPTVQIPYTANTIHNVVERLDDEAAKGIRERAWGSVLARTRGEGDITMYMDVTNLPYLLFPALGVSNVETVESGVYEHTIARKAGNPPTTVCLNVYNTYDTRKYHYGVANTLEVTFSDGLVECTSGFLSKKEEDSSETAPGVTEQNVLTFKDAYIYFGDDLKEAELNYQLGQNEKHLTAFTLTINNNAEAQYASGASSPEQISIGQFEVGGNYTLFFESSDERDAFEATTASGSQRAMVVSFKGGTIGSTTEEIYIAIPKFHLTDRGIDTAPAGFVTENPTFVADYDSTYGSIFVKVINETSSYTGEGTSSSSSSSSTSSSSSSSFSSSSSSSG